MLLVGGLGAASLSDPLSTTPWVGLYVAIACLVVGLVLICVPAVLALLDHDEAARRDVQRL